MHVPGVLRGGLDQLIPVAYEVRTAHTSASGRKAERSNPTECRYCNHWHSCQSVRFPGTLRMCRAFTRHGLSPCASRTSKSGIQYTPVDSMATVVTPQLTSQSAIS